MRATPVIDPTLLAPPPRKDRGYNRVASGPVGFAPPAPPVKGALPPAARLGIRYERRVRQFLSPIAANLGLDLWDHQRLQVGGSTAEPDFVLVSASAAGLLIEVKYTWEDTLNQRAFYAGLLRLLGISPVVSCTICRNILPSTPTDLIVRDFYSIADNSVFQLWV
jgi:hypothetical protein